MVKTNKMRTIFSSYALLKESILFTAILFFVLLVNSAIIHFDMMYPEQPLIYTANLAIHSLKDLLQVYLQPKMLHLSIPFFRPSGHFLLYQLLMPLLGWHNTKALIIVNLLFLALTGYVLIKLYNLLFSGLRVGGFIAFSLYLMHPAMMLSRISVLHFEFAYVFFGILALYSFVLFIHRNNREQQTQYRYFEFLFLALFSYMLAVTFKEPAIMWGPVFLLYFCINLYQNQSNSIYAAIRHNKQIQQILILLIMVTAVVTLYITLSWPTWTQHPLRNHIAISKKMAVAYEFFKDIFAFQVNPSVFSSQLLWRNVVFPLEAQFILNAFFILTLINTALVFLTEKNAVYKKSLVFLYGAAFLFLVLPINWSMGLPWHLNLCILFLSLMMGFSFEHLCLYISLDKAKINLYGSILAACIGLTTISVNIANLHYIQARAGFALSVGRNAVLHPPHIKNQLDATSIIVVEDSLLHDAYLLGASFYPAITANLNNPNLGANEEHYQKHAASIFIKHQLVYNGSLFKWAYLQPSLQEEIYPFQVEHMETVPDIILYSWLQQEKNIFCLGYDDQGNWHDKTANFKKNLQLEKLRRHLVTNEYLLTPATAFQGHISHIRQIHFPDHQLCQVECDQNKLCKGFTYMQPNKGTKGHAQCRFYDLISADNRSFCADCLGFIKNA